MKEFMDKLADLLLIPVSKMVTIMLGAYTTLWGAWVLNPYLNTFSSAKLYSVLLAFIPSELLWGGLAIVAGIVTIYGAVKEYAYPEVYGSAVSGIHWFIIATFYFLGDVANTGGITALFLALLSTYIYLNTKFNHLNPVCVTPDEE